MAGLLDDIFGGKPFWEKDTPPPRPKRQPSIYDQVLPSGEPLDLSPRIDNRTERLRGRVKVREDIQVLSNEARRKKLQEYYADVSDIIPEEFFAIKCSQMGELWKKVGGEPLYGPDKSQREPYLKINTEILALVESKVFEVSSDLSQNSEILRKKMEYIMYLLCEYYLPEKIRLDYLDGDMYSYNPEKRDKFPYALEAYSRLRPSRLSQEEWKSFLYGSPSIHPKVNEIQPPFIDTRILAPRSLNSEAGMALKRAFKVGVFDSQSSIFVLKQNGKNITLVYRQGVLVSSAFVSPGALTEDPNTGKPRDTPNGVYLIGKYSHSTATWFSGPSSSLMPFATMLKRKPKLGTKIDSFSHQGEGFHAPPVDKSGSGVRIASVNGNHLSHGCVRTPAIQAMILFFLTRKDTDPAESDLSNGSYVHVQSDLNLPQLIMGYSDNFPSVGSILPKVEKSDLPPLPFLLDPKILYQRSRELVGEGEVKFFMNYFGLNSIEQLQKKVLEIQGIGGSGFIDHQTLEKIYTQYYFGPNSTDEMRSFSEQIDRILSSGDRTLQLKEGRKLLGKIYSESGIHVGNIFARYFSHKYLLASGNKSDMFSSQYFFGPQNATKFYDVVSSDVVDTETQRKWSVLVDTETFRNSRVSYPDNLVDFTQIYNINTGGSKNVVFLVKSLDGKMNHLVVYAGGKLISWNKVYSKIGGSFTNLEEIQRDGGIPYLYFTYIMTKFSGEDYKIISLL